MTNEESVTWLTQEAFDRLNAELEELKGPGRVAIAQRIQAAREEGDLKENGGYHAAKDEQGKMESRIRQLSDLLSKAVVGETGQFDGTIVSGTIVTAILLGEETRFLLGSREIAEDEELDVYSEQSPLGAAIKGLKAGDKASYLAPSGKEIQVEITKVEPYGA